MASKGTIQLQLQIDTTFKNIKSEVDSLNQALKGIKFDNKAFGSGIVDSVKNQTAEIKNTLQSITNFQFNGGNTKVWNALVQDFRNQANDLRQLYNQLSSIQLPDTSKIINEGAGLAEAQKELANLKNEAAAAEEILSGLTQEYAEMSKNGGPAEDFKELGQLMGEAGTKAEDYKEKIAAQEQVVEDLAKKNQAYHDQISSINNAQSILNTTTTQLGKTLNEVAEFEAQGIITAEDHKRVIAEQNKEEKERAAATREAAKALEEAAKAADEKAEEDRKAAEALEEQIKKEEEAQKIWQQTSATFVSDFEKAASGSDKLTTALGNQIAKWTSLGFIVRTATNAIRDIVQTYQELDDNLSAISAVSGITTDQLWGDMPQMIDNANELALSVNDLTNGMLLFYQQGLSTEETEIRLNAAGKMAAISQQDLSTAVDQLTSTMNAFGMSGDDAANVVDVFANMAGKTATDVEELATAMARTASIAKNAGMSFEQTTAFLATMEETTRLSAETIGNSMKSIIARFQKLKTDPTSLLEDGVNANDVEKALKKANVALRDTEGNFRNIGDVIMELSAKWDTLDTNTQKYIATMAAGTQQSSNFIALVSNYQSNVDNLAYAMDSAGAAEEQFAAVSTNISSALTRLDNNWTALKTSFGEGRSVLIDVIDAFSGFLEFLSKAGAGFVTAAAGVALLSAKLLVLGIQQSKRAAMESMLLTIDSASIATTDKQVAANILLEASSKKLSAAYVQERLANLGLSEADAAEIAMKYSQATANGVATLSWEGLTTAIKGATTAVLEFLFTNPVGWAILAAGAFIVVSKALDAFGISAKGATRRAEEARQKVEETTSELSNIEQELQNVNDKIAEINGQDYISLTDSQELATLTQERIELERQVQALKDKKELQQQKSITEDINAFNRNKTGKDYTLYQAGLDESLYDKNSIDEAKSQLDDFRSYAIQIINDYDERKKEGLDISDELQTAYEEAVDWRNKIDKVISPETFVKNALMDTTFADAEVLAKAKAEGEQIGQAEASGVLAGADAANAEYDFFERYLTDDEFLDKIGATSDEVSGLLETLYQLSQNEDDARDKLEKLSSTSLQYGNIANSQRQIILWNDQAIEKYGASIQDWLADGETVEDLRNSISTALGSWDYFNSNGAANENSGFAIAFSPLLQTDDGPVVLSREEVSNYIAKVIQAATDSEGNIDYDKILQFDATGFHEEVNGAMTHVHGLIAGVENATNELNKDAKNTGADIAAISGETSGQVRGQLIEDSEYCQKAMHDVQDSFVLISDAISEQNPVLGDLLKAFESLLGINLSGVADEMSNIGDSTESTNESVNSLKTQMSEVSNAASDLKNAASDLSGVADAYKTLTTAIKDYNADGNITLSNLESLLSLSPEYLSCLEMENGQLSLNTEGLKGIVLMRIQAAKAAAYQSAMEQIQAITMSSSATAASTAGEAIAGMEAATSNAATAMSTASNTAATSTGTMANLAQSGYTVAAGFDTAASSAANFNNVLANKLTEAGTGIKYTAEDVASMIAGDISGITDVLGDAVGNVITGLQSQLSMLDNLENKVNSMDFSSFIGKYGGSKKGGSGGSGTKDATKASDELKNALEEQKKALQKQQKELEKSKSAIEKQKKALEDQKKALEETNKQLQENYKLYVKLIKSRLNDEIDRQTTRIEAFYGAIKDTVQSEIDSFNNQLDTLKKQADELKSKADELQDAADQQEDSLNKLYDAAQAYYDATQDGLDNQIDSYDKVIDRNKEHIDLLNEQKDAIQDQIDALDTAADSESKLLALEKARDALANARNQKTRMVLTNGGGWRLRTDKSEISNAQSNLASAQRDYQKEILERQQKKIEEQTDEIEKQNNNLENIKSDLEDQKDALDNIKVQWDKAQDTLGKTTSELEEQTNLIRQFQYGNDASRQDQLSNFSEQVSNNNQQQQAASDATNRANEASNKYDQQSNEDVQGSIAEAIKKLEEQQNQADEALKKYFENQLSNNAETAQIQQEMKDLIDQMVNGQIGQLENFAQFYETINGALEQANSNATQTADYINNINAAIDRYDEWSNRLDMTTDEINQRQAIMNEINNATLDSLLEGGSTFGQLQEQYEQIVRNNDEAKRIQGQIDELNEQASVIQTQINALKEQENKISEQEKELSNANSNKTANAAKAAGNTAASGAKAAGSGIRTNADKNTARIIDAINSKDISVTIQETSKGSGGGSGKYLMARYNTGGMLGFSHGGVDDVTTVAAVHGSKNRPELVLNNSQSAALFKYIDSMTRIPTLSSAGSARNALMGFGTTNNANNNGTNFTNCEFNVESNADNLDSLVQDLKQSASIRR